MRRSVKSTILPDSVDAHERTRDYITEEEFSALIESTKGSRHRWRNASMLMVTAPFKFHLTVSRKPLVISRHFPSSTICADVA